jgi:hypothetical protein
MSEAIVSWNPESTPRTTFASKTHWDAITIYKEPIKKLDTLTITIVDNNGNIIDNNSSDITFLTLKFYCKVIVPLPPVISTYETPKTPVVENSPVVKDQKNNYVMYVILAILLALGAKFFLPL